MDRQLIGGADRLLWLSRGDLKGETESEITAAQDRELQTKYHATVILQTDKQAANADCVNSLV
jgi:hypothetical protein